MVKKQIQTACKWVATTLWWLALLLLALLLVCVIGAKLRGRVPQIFGYSVMQIISGSMEEEIPTGSYILVRSCDPTAVEPGQIISFYSDDPAIYGMPNTHRVKEILHLADGSLAFRTQGDAADHPDPLPARADALIGVYCGRLDGLTAFSQMLHGNGMFVLLILLQFGTVALVVLTLLHRSPEEETEKDSKQ